MAECQLLAVLLAVGCLVSTASAIKLKFQTEECMTYT